MAIALIINNLQMANNKKMERGCFKTPSFRILQSYYTFPSF